MTYRRIPALGWAAAVFGTATFLTSTQARAQSPPAGSYQQSCTNVSVSGTTLSASCKTMSGSWSQTQLSDYNQCQQPPANLDGVLACNIGGTPPSGSYTATCRNAWWDNGVLNAECQTTSGAWTQTALQNASQCTSAPSNADGTLLCNIGGTPPPGSYTATCRYVWVDNGTLNAQCQNGAGLWMQAQLSGFAQCEQPPANLDGVLACNIGGTPPAGSYTATCRNAWWDNGMLNAECQTDSGSWLQTALQNASQCSTPPANINGALICNIGGTPPSGSYTASCPYEWVVNGTLNAQCQNVSGALVFSQLPNYGQCSQPPANFDGTLVCNIGGTPPSGSYTATCRYEWVDNGQLNAECLTASGQWVATSLTNYTSCTTPPVNLGGILSCSFTPQTPTPVGSYQATCKYILVSGTSISAVCETIFGQWIHTTLSNYTFCTSGISNINGILSCPSPCETGSAEPATFLATATTLELQQQSNWCWAASGQMIMAYWGKYLTQCAEVNLEHKVTDACGHPFWSLPVLTDAQGNCIGANCGGSPPLSSYGFTGNWNSTPLTWSQLESAVACENAPFWFAWNWGGGGGHVMVVYGYETQNGTDSVWVLNPLDADPELDLYDDWSTEPNLNACPDSQSHCFQGDFTEVSRVSP